MEKEVIEEIPIDDYVFSGLAVSSTKDFLTKSKPRRKRTRELHLRMTEEEYEKYLSLLSQSGLSQQHYLLRRALEQKILSGNLTDTIFEIHEKLAVFLRELNSIGININQLAHKANSDNSIDASVFIILAQFLKDIGSLKEKSSEFFDISTTLIRNINNDIL